VCHYRARSINPLTAQSIRGGPSTKARVGTPRENQCVCPSCNCDAEESWSLITPLMQNRAARPRRKIDIHVAWPIDIIISGRDATRVSPQRVSSPLPLRLPPVPPRSPFPASVGLRSRSGGVVCESDRLRSRLNGRPGENYSHIICNYFRKMPIGYSCIRYTWRADLRRRNGRGECTCIPCM